jgi:hypothetical protein
MSKRNFILLDIEAERKQEAHWGATDRLNTAYHWASYITHYATRNLAGNPNQFDREKFAEDMVKVAALAVAALENKDTM